MFKKKKGRINPLSELHFISSLSLEESVLLVGDLADDSHKVTITEKNPNQFTFEINDTRKAQVRGTLQRWQGTETRIVASGYTPGGDIALRLPLLFIIIFGAMQLLTLIDGVTQENIVILFFVIFFIVFLLAIGASAISELRDLHMKTLHFRERDRLLQLIIDTFKSSGEVEAYQEAHTREEPTLREKYHHEKGDKEFLQELEAHNQAKNTIQHK